MVIGYDMPGRVPNEPRAFRGCCLKFRCVNNLDKDNGRIDIRVNLVKRRLQVCDKVSIGLIIYDGYNTTQGVWLGSGLKNGQGSKR